MSAVGPVGWHTPGPGEVATHQWSAPMGAEPTNEQSEEEPDARVDPE